MADSWRTWSDDLDAVCGVRWEDFDSSDKREVGDGSLCRKIRVGALPDPVRIAARERDEADLLRVEGLPIEHVATCCGVVLFANSRAIAL